jgi:phospholipid/cholesterol/gamma-HCH transport system permease protein
MAEKESNNNVESRFHQFFWELADTTRFAGRVLRETFRGRFEWTEFWRQCYVIGLKTLGLISITGFIMGLVLTMQTRPVMEDLGADAWLPGVIMVAIIREISPVIGGLIFAGKVGSGIGAELGSMRVTDQIDAMEVSGTNPMNYLVATRVMATTLMLPILVLYSDGVAFLGSFVGVNMGNSISLKLFLAQAIDQLWYFDLIPATIKSFFFGFAIGVVSCYKGYHTTGGTQGVGVSANTAVVISSLVIFILDLIAVQITELLIW